MENVDSVLTLNISGPFNILCELQEFCPFKMEESELKLFRMFKVLQRIEKKQ